MNNWRLCLMATSVAFCGLMLSPGITRADDLTGSAGITWLYPNGAMAIGTDTIAVGSSLSCPADMASPICAGYGEDGSQVFSVGSSTISYEASGYPTTGGGDYLDTPFDGFDFTGLTFASGNSLTGFTLTTDIAGLTSSDVTFTPSSIEINLAGLPVNGDFTLTLISGTTVPAPEPSTLVMLGVGLLALVGFTRKKANAYA